MQWLREVALEQRNFMWAFQARYERNVSAQCEVFLQLLLGACESFSLFLMLLGCAGRL
jgi:hypothetical protein